MVSIKLFVTFAQQLWWKLCLIFLHLLFICCSTDYSSLMDPFFPFTALLTHSLLTGFLAVELWSFFLTLSSNPSFSFLIIQFSSCAVYLSFIPFSCFFSCTITEIYFRNLLSCIFVGKQGRPSLVFKCLFLMLAFHLF